MTSAGTLARSLCLTSWQRLCSARLHRSSSPSTIAWLGLDDGEYEPVERSRLIELGPTALAEQIDRP